MYSDPNSPDTDGDAIPDNHDKNTLVFNDRIYFRDTAVEYAMMWGGSSDKQLNNEEDYYYLGEPDCANFVSQCVYEGGLPSDDKWYMREYYGSSLSAHINVIFDGGNYEDGWLWSDAWVRAEEQYNYILDEHASYEKTFQTYEELIEILNEGIVQKGDLLYFICDGNVKHATIITEVTASDVFLAGHSNYYTHDSLAGKFESGALTAYTSFSIVGIEEHYKED